MFSGLKSRMKSLTRNGCPQWEALPGGAEAGEEEGARALPTPTDVSLVECSICLGQLVSPRVLSCGHQFCASCLSGMGPGKDDPVVCPNCRQVTAHADITTPLVYDIHGIIENFRKGNRQEEEDMPCDVCQTAGVSAKVKCQECQTTLCAGCLEKHQEMSVLAGHTVTHLSRAAYCPQHPADVACIYCHDCACIACFKCLLRNHQGHAQEDIKLLAKQSQINIKSYINAQKSRHIDLKVVQDAKDAVDQLKQNHACAKEVIKRVKDAAMSLCANMDATLEEIDDKTTMALDHMTEKLSVIDDIKDAQNLLLTFNNDLLENGADVDLINAARALPAITKIQADTVFAKIPEFNDILSSFLTVVEGVNRQKFYRDEDNSFPVSHHCRPWALTYINQLVKGEYKVTGMRFNEEEKELILRSTDPESALHCFRFSDKLKAFALLRHFAIPEIHHWSRPMSLDTKRSLILAPSGRNGLYRISMDGTIYDRIPGYNMDYCAVDYKTIADRYIVADEQSGRLVIIHPISKQMTQTLSSPREAQSLNIHLGVLSHPNMTAVSHSSHNRIHVYRANGDMEACLGPEVGGTSLHHPMGVSYDLSGSLVVCDSGNARVLRLWSDTSGWNHQVLLEMEDLGGEPSLVEIDSANKFMAVLVGSSTIKLYSF